MFQDGDITTISLVSVMISIIEIRVVVVVVFFSFSVWIQLDCFLTFNVSVNLGDKYHKNTALHWAVLAGNTTVISLLLEAGLMLKYPEYQGKNSLY